MKTGAHRSAGADAAGSARPGSPPNLAAKRPIKPAASASVAPEPKAVPPTSPALGAGASEKKSGRDSPQEPIRVAVVAPNAATRAHLAKLIEQFSDLEFVGAFRNPDATENEVTRLETKVILTTADGPASGRETIRKLKFLFPKLPIVINGVSRDGESIFSSLIAGASGCVAKSAPLDQFKAAIIETAGDRVFLCRRAVWEAKEQLRRIASKPGRQQLSEKEQEVCIWLAARHEKDIARGLELSFKTVHTHVEAVYHKLAVHHRSDLLALLAPTAATA